MPRRLSFAFSPEVSLALSVRLVEMLFVMAIAGCASLLGPRTVDVSLGQLQAVIDQRFPVSNRYLALIDITVSTPRVSLRPDANRIAVQLDAHAGEGLLGAARNGALVLTSMLRFEPRDNTLRLAQVRVERFAFDGASGLLQRQIDALGGLLTEQLLEGRVIHTLRPKDIDALQSRGYVPGEIKVTATGLQLTLLPA